MAPNDGSGDVVGRRFPSSGIILSTDMPLILFCTVNTLERRSWVAQETAMLALRQVWQHESNLWLVGSFVLMPDHLHFMCCPRNAADNVGVERWTAYWKDGFAKVVMQTDWKWQSKLFHTRMRSDSHYREKLDYMRNNPVERGLVTCAEDWPWRGEIHSIADHNRSFGDPDRCKT